MAHYIDYITLICYIFCLILNWKANKHQKVKNTITRWIHSMLLQCVDSGQNIQPTKTVQVHHSPSCSYTSMQRLTQYIWKMEISSSASSIMFSAAKSKSWKLCTKQCIILCTHLQCSAMEYQHTVTCMWLNIDCYHQHQNCYYQIRSTLWIWQHRFRVFASILPNKFNAGLITIDTI